MDGTPHVDAGQVFWPSSRADLLDVVLSLVKRFTGVTSLTLDSDGDVSLRYGETTIVVRVDPDSPVVSLFSPVLVKVECSFELLQSLNEFNHSSQFAKLCLLGPTVFAVTEIHGKPFVPHHLEEALKFFGSFCDEKARELAGRFGTVERLDGKDRRGPTPMESVN
jgi:hypothetical protein